VESGVQVVQRWILARLRHQQFFSLAEANRAISSLLSELNNRPFRKLPGSRRSRFEELDMMALRPLPATPYEYAEWKRAKVGIDYHIEVDRHYYSAPSSLLSRQVDVRVTASTVEILHQGKRVASHPRSRARGSHTTLSEHMPKSHRAHMDWTPGRFLTWSAQIGPNTRDLVRHLLYNKPHPEMGYRSCLGLLQLARRFGEERLEAACRRSLLLGAPARRSVLSILENGLDRHPLPGDEDAKAASDQPVAHENLRGAAYYN
jgi:transposase